MSKIKFFNGRIFEFIVNFIISFIVSVGIPIIYFLIFISIQPREVTKIDNYFKKKITQTTKMYINYSKTIITTKKLTKLRLIIDNVTISNKNFSINIPLTIIDIKILNIFRRKHIVDSIFLKNMTVKITGTNIVKQQHYIKKPQTLNNFFEKNWLKFIGNAFDRYKDYLIFRTISINNFNFVDNNDENTVINNLLLTTKSNYNSININLNLNGKLYSGNSSNFNIKSSCNYTFFDKNISCSVDIFNLSFVDITNLVANRFNIGIIDKYNNKIFGNFTLKLSFDINNDFEKIDNFKFFILSNKGNFEIDELFDKKIFFKNFIIDGIINTNGKIINIKKSSIDLYTSENNDKINHFDLKILTKKNNDIILRILSNEIYIQDLGVLWSKKLNSNSNIRKWVIDSVSLGTVKNVDTRLVLSKNNDKNQYLLKTIDAIFDLNKNTLNYDDNFPSIKNIVGKAIFTKDNMKIIIDTADSESSLLTNGEIFLNFDDLNLCIKTGVFGKTHDLGHYIDYLNKQKIEKILDKYIEGIATTTVNIVLPLNNIKTMFENSKISINSDLSVKNNFIFSKNSEVILDIQKHKKSNTFNTTVDLTFSTIDYKIIDFMKNNNQSIKLYLDIVIDGNFILLDNIKTIDGDILSLNGRGIISNGILQSLNINDFKYKDMKVDIFIKSKDNNDFFVNLLSNKITLNLNNSRNDNKINSDFTFDNLIDNNMVFIAKANNVTIDNYNFTNLDLYVLYKNKKLQKSNIIIYDIENNKIEYNVEYEKNKKHNIFNLTVKNLGNVLNNFSITNKISGGDLQITGNYKNKIAEMKLIVKNNFDYLHSNNSRIVKLLLDNSRLSKKVKKRLNRTVFKYKKLKAELNYNFNNHILDIKRFFLDSKNLFTGLDISGTGNMNISTGKTNIIGTIIPLNIVNSLFGINKIPILNRVLFNKKFGGLFIVGFELTKNSFEDKNVIKITKYDTFINSVKSSGLLFMLFLL